MTRGLTNRQAERVLSHVAAEHGLTPAMLTGRSQNAKVCRARWQAWDAMIRDLGASAVEAGLATGHDHSTVLHGLRRLHAVRG